MNLPFRPQKKKKTLQAATARRGREADFTEEPNVKLSSAFLVVLVLHVVAVGGIYAFNALKSHQPPTYEDAENPMPQPAAQTAANTQVDAPATPAAPIVYRVKSGDTIAKIAAAYGVGTGDIIDLNDLRETGGIHVGQDLKLPPGAALSDDQPATPKQAAVLRDSGAVYTVRSGDTPVSIARKLHVGYDDLIELNNIENPKKLKIGLKLKIPMKRMAV